MGVIPNPKIAFIFPISCILALIFPIFMKYFPKCEGKGCFPKSQIKSLQIVQSFFFPNLKCQASSHLLRVYSTVCDGHGEKSPKTRFLMIQRLKYLLMITKHPLNLFDLSCSDFVVYLQNYFVVYLQKHFVVYLQKLFAVYLQKTFCGLFAKTFCGLFAKNNPF